MATKLQRYEAAVKLSTGQVVKYHNINTGLFKFHKFLCEKFNDNQRWVFYSVRRIETKEDIGTFVNATKDEDIHALRIYAENEPNPTKTGYTFSLPFVRNGYTLNRRLFIANSQVLDRDEQSIVISERMFAKMIKEAKNALYEFYLNKKHSIVPNEIELGVFDSKKVLITKKGKQGTEPTQNYP